MPSDASHGTAVDLLPQHTALLAASAISDDVARARGYRSVKQKARLSELGFSQSQIRVPALLIPIWNVQGEVALYQTRPDEPRLVKGKAVKYETPRGSRMVLDVPPWVRGRLEDPNLPLFITEGIRKADAAVSAGLCCIALLGVWNWRGTNDLGGKVALPDFESIALNGRDVYIAFDSDAWTNAQVAKALLRFREFLASRGAHCRVIRLPIGPGGVKTGLDDYLAGGHSVADLLALASDDAGGSVLNLARTSDDATRSAAARIVDLADEVELFHTPAGAPYATLVNGDHRETHAVRSLPFRSWLRRRYWEAHRQPASGNALADAVETIAARAEFEGEIIPVSTRVAEHGGRLYVDLADEAWRVVEIDLDGWRLSPAPPVRFRRGTSAAALPIPTSGGSLEALRQFVNVAPGDGWFLFVGSLVAAFRARGPYVVLILHGVQGSAKSTGARIFKALTDPSRSALRGGPSDQQALLITAQNNWVVAFDNVSQLQPWLSDALCRLSTGGGLGKRQLYTDQEEIVLEAQRPLVLTGITEIATRGDLADRAVIVEQLAIADAGRRSEDEFWRAFEEVRPQILGALFDAVSAAIANEAAVSVEHMPRMADACRWVTAAEPALGWRTGTFGEAYGRNRHEGHAIALEASPISGPLEELARRGEWKGSAADLLQELVSVAAAALTRERDWPKNPAALTAALKRLAPSLRVAGVEWTRLPRTGASRPHSIRMVAGASVTSVTTDIGRASQADGRDGRDGFDRPEPSGVDLLAEAIRIFGGDIEKMGGSA